MIRRVFPFFTLLLMAVGMGAAVSPSNAHAQSQLAQDLCLARWEWISDKEQGDFWRGPFPDNLLGVLDLRSLPQQGSLGPIADGWGLFSYAQPMGSTGMICYGNDLDVGISTAQADTLALVLGKNIGDFRSRTPRSLIREILVIHADPTGQNFWKPLWSNPQKNQKIALGGFGLIYDQPIDESSVAFQKTLEIIQSDYRRLKAEGMDLTTLQKTTGFHCLDFFKRDCLQGDLDKLLPSEFRSDGFLKPSTTIGDTFVEATTNTNLESHTPTGPNAGTGWALMKAAAGEFLVLESSDKVSNVVIANNNIRSRMTDDLSSADHSAQATVTIAVNGTHGGVSVRCSAAADTCYFGRGKTNGIDIIDYQIFKVVTGTETELVTVTGLTDIRSNNIMKLEVSGSDLELFAIDGATSRLTVSDTFITENFQGGLYGRANGTSRASWDDFEAADLGAAPTASRVVIIE